MRSFLIALCLLSAVTTSLAQKLDGNNTDTVKTPAASPTTKTQTNKPLNDTADLLVYMSTRKAFQTVAVDESGVIQLKDWPDGEISVIFPDNDFARYTLQVNQTEPTIISFSCNGSEKCESILLTDMKEGRISLQVVGKEIVAIGKKRVRIPLTDKMAYIRIVPVTPAAQNKEEAKQTPGGIYAALQARDDSRQLHVPFNRDGLKPGQFYLPAQNPDRKGRGCKGCRGIPVDCYVDTIRSLYNQLLQKPCTDGNQRAAKATSLKYVVVIDARANIAMNHVAKVTYLKLKNRPGYEFYRVKKHLSPKAYHELQLNILCSKDSNYVVVRDEGRNLFADGSSQFQESILATQKTPILFNDSTSKQAEAKKNVDSTQYVRLTAKLLSPSELLRENAPAQAARLELPEPIIRLIDSSARNPEKFDTAYLSSKTKFFEQTVFKYRQLRDSIKKNAQSRTDSEKIMSAQKQLISEGQSAIDDLFVYGYQDEAGKLKTDLLSLMEALKNFNYHYYALDYSADGWAKDITNLKNRMIEVFGIPVTSNAEDLARSLVRRVKTDPYIPSSYYADFEDDIRTIQAQYKTINSKVPQLKILAKQVDVPNKDLFSLKVNEANSHPETIFLREFPVSLGFQIDFSTGFFVSGIRSPEFSLVPVTYRYHGSQTYTSSMGQDSVVYPVGLVKDTTGNLIQKKANDFSYGTGFMLHAYTRTGQFYNFGLATGIMFSGNGNSSSTFQLLLGGSVMFSTGLTRLALSGGLCFGRETELTDYASQYAWEKRDTGNQVFSTIHQVPKFYPNANPEYHTFWRTTGFMGITFNFASASIGKKVEVK